MMNSTGRRLIQTPGLLSTVQAIAAVMSSSIYSRPMPSVSGGNLAIISKADSSQKGYNYTSAMIQWRSFNFTYGTVEFRAKMAGGRGTWPTVCPSGRSDERSSNLRRLRQCLSRRSRLLNREVLTVNQDTLGKQGRSLIRNGTAEIWTMRPIATTPRCRRTARFC